VVHITPKEYLTDWIEKFVRYRGALSGSAGIEKKDGMICTNERCFLACPSLNFGDIEKISENDTAVVTFNTLENFDFLLNHWGKLKDVKNLTIYFINPFSKLDKKWVIKPHVHDRICEQNSLKKGLRSIFGMVEVITYKQMDQL